MATTFEYIFSLQDRVSAKIGGITVSSTKMIDKFGEMRSKQDAVNAVLGETGRTMNVLREKIDLLHQERDLLPVDNIEGLRAYNKEIKKLTGEVAKLEALDGGKLKKWSDEAFAAMPGADLIKNPLVTAIAGIAAVTRQGMNFDEGMAKVNITAQMDGRSFDDLRTKIKQVAIDNKVDIAVAPVGFEAINSQVNDVDLSMSILDASLKGSKAGFTDLNTVSSALAQSLSIIGKENTNAQEVLDTFFAAKRVGAGEFADFARYMPGLIAGASNMGIGFKETAGVFAYMTGKGQSAERAAVLMENAFSALGKADIRGKMEKAGIKVFDDTGKMRSIVDIFTDLQGVLGGLNDEQKSSLLEKFGLVDKEAKGAFAILTSDTAKLRDSMAEVAASSGETDRAINYSANSVQRATEVWSTFKNIGLQLGTYMLPVVSVGLNVVGGILDVTSTLLDKIGGATSWWSDKLQEGNVVILAVTGAVGGVTTALALYYAWGQRSLVADAARQVMNGAIAVSTKVMAAAQWMLNTAMYGCPVVWIVAAFAAVGAGVVLLWNKFEWFRVGVLGTWEVIKEFGKTLFQSIVSPFTKILSGLGAVGRALVALVKGDFKTAAGEAKEGVKNIMSGMAGANPVSVVASTFKNGDYSGAWEKGKAAGRSSWQQKGSGKKDESISVVPDAPTVADVPVKPIDFDGLMKKLEKSKKGATKGQKAQKVDLSAQAQNYAETAEYTAIRAAITPKVTIPAPAAPVAGMPQTKNIAPVVNIAAPEPVRTAVNVTAPSVDVPTPVVTMPPVANAAMPVKAVDTTDYKDTGHENTLSDIMQNVRKIAAAISVPLAIAMPTETSATQMPDIISESNVTTEYNQETTDQSHEETKEIRIDNITIHVTELNDQGTDDITNKIKEALREALA